MTVKAGGDSEGEGGVRGRESDSEGGGRREGVTVKAEGGRG